MLRIGIDLDGVIVNFMEGYTKAVAPDYKFDHSKVDRWKWGRVVFGKEKDSHFWTVTAKNPEFWLQLRPYSQHDCTLTNLLTQRHMVYFVTSKPKGVEKAAAEWLRTHVGKHHEGQLVVASDKGSIAKGLELDAMIDDKPENLVDVYTARPETKCILIDQPWNHAAENGAYSVRCYSIKDAYDYAEFGIWRNRSSQHSLNLTS